MIDVNRNKPATTNQISNAKPNVPRSDSILTGFIANSTNGGMNKVIHFKKVMAGEFHKEYRLNMNIKMLTPKSPSYQNLYATFRAYFVPNIRVWDNAEKYTAQKGGSAEIKIKEIPNLGGLEIPVVADQQSDYETLLSNTTTWRDSWISSYIPRIGMFQFKDTGEEFFTTLPAVSVLPLRGRIAIYNEFERNREYDAELKEYKGDTVTPGELNSYMPKYNATNSLGDYDVYQMRAKANDSYYTDYRTELQGFEENFPTTIGSGYDMSADTALLNWAQWEMKIAEARSQAENAQMRDVEVIRKLRGSKLLTEGRVNLLGQRTVALNYSAVTQNANTNSNDVNQEYRTIGTQGAYSFTHIDLPIYAAQEFNEEGYIHIIMTISSDSVFETGFDRMELNVTPLDEYRPDMLEDKKDVLYLCETGTTGVDVADSSYYNQVVGFKRKYSEYFKLNNCIGGDMTSNNYFESDGWYYPVMDEIVQTQKTYQFFELDRNLYIDQDENIIFNKKPWKNYTDLLINKNQAVKNEIETVGFTGLDEIDTAIRVKGQNQVFFVGKATCIAVLPIDDSIKDNYTQWGEH